MISNLKWIEILVSQSKVQGEARINFEVILDIRRRLPIRVGIVRPIEAVHITAVNAHEEIRLRAPGKRRGGESVAGGRILDSGRKWGKVHLALRYLLILQLTIFFQPEAHAEFQFVTTIDLREVLVEIVNPGIDRVRVSAAVEHIPEIAAGDARETDTVERIWQAQGLR